MEDNTKKIIMARQLQMIQDQIDALSDRIIALTSDAQNDAKSSAGDKHETGLAMMHLEQEKCNAKIQDLLKTKDSLQKLGFPTQKDQVVRGHLVLVNNMWLLISEALPKIEIDSQTIFSVSIESPLGKNVLGKREGDTVEVQGKKYTIHKIV